MDVSWSILQRALEDEVLERIDLCLAQHILKGHSSESLPEAAAICHLSLALRSGHLCVRLDGNGIKPLPQMFWGRYSQEVEGLIEEGVKRMMAAAPPGIATTPEALYFHRYWVEENACAELIRKHEDVKPSVKIDACIFEKRLDEHSKLLPHQKEAVRKALDHTITLITGGPGTGKTYTAGCLIHTLYSSLSVEQRKNFRIALAAPTGKAASHLLQSISSGLALDAALMSSSTLHMLLGISPYTSESKLKLSQDLILVDESSMIDIRLMVALLKALKPGARLILLGDHRQLPPVEPGAPFADMIRYRSSLQDSSLHPARLNVCLRADLREINDLAEAIDQGDERAVFNCLSAGHSSVKGGILPDATHFGDIVESLADMFPPLAILGDYPDPHALKAFRVLSSIKKGLWGVDSLNQALHKALLARVPRGQTPAIPILLTANDHQLKLYNGEVGFLLKDRAFFPIPDGLWREVPAKILPRYQYGYCLSVHKSQGSEFDKVVVMLPNGSETLGRAVLYTAVTRARRGVEIWHEEDALRDTLAAEQPRLSGLRIR